MDGQDLFPFFLMSVFDTGNQNPLLVRVLPALLPRSNERVLAATVTASRQIRAETQKEQQLVAEAIDAAGTKLKKAEDLAEFPTLDAAFKRLPQTVQIEIFAKKNTTSTTGTTTTTSTRRR